MANPNLVNVATINAGNLGFNLSNTLTTTLSVTGRQSLSISSWRSII